jgi:hypothetical protein
MSMVTENIGPILVVTGALTAAASLGGFLWPRSLFQLFFGAAASGEATTLVTRHWGWLGFLIGALMVYAAFAPGLRVPVVVVAALEKTVFAGLVFSGPFRKSGLARWAAAGDSFMVLIYVLYLLGF